MSVEAMRGCGYRKVGGLYLCGGGQGMDCDRLPYELEICPTCGNGVKFTRGWTWIDWDAYAGNHNSENNGKLPSDCGCMNRPGWKVYCPVCQPNAYSQPFGLLWVGEASYTPHSFIQEALTMGVSRRIAAVPKKLKLGETWVLFANKNAVRAHMEPDGSNEDVPGVFYVFRPTSLEMLVWESEAKPEYIEDLEKRGITAVIIPDGDEDHNPATKTKMSADDRADVEQSNKISLLRQSIGG